MEASIAGEEEVPRSCRQPKERNFTTKRSSSWSQRLIWVVAIGLAAWVLAEPQVSPSCVRELQHPPSAHELVQTAPLTAHPAYHTDPHTEQHLMNSFLAAQRCIHASMNAGSASHNAGRNAKSCDNLKTKLKQISRSQHSKVSSQRGWLSSLRFASSLVVDAYMAPYPSRASRLAANPLTFQNLQHHRPHIVFASGASVGIDNHLFSRSFSAVANQNDVAGLGSHLRSQPQRRSMTRLLSTATPADSSAPQTSTVEERMLQLEKTIADLNDGEAINVNSPKQVSTALFGSPQPAPKATLERIAKGLPASLVDDVPDVRSQQLAQNILLLRVLRKQQSDMAKGTTVASKADAAKSANAEKKDSRAKGEEIPPQYPSPDGKQASGNANARTANRAISHDEWIEYLFANPKCKVDPYWKEPLLRINKSTAQALIPQLDCEQCPMGYDPLGSPHPPSWNRFSLDLGALSSSSPTAARSARSTQGRKGTFLHFCRAEKERHPHCIVLTRCGDFYETYGLDAILLVEHVGLNSMAGKCKAGCPHRNIQATLTAMTQAGFSVAVYEEVSETQLATTPTGGAGSSSAFRGTATGIGSETGSTRRSAVASTGASPSSSKQLKTRVLTQIVSPASPIYLYDQWLLSSADDPQKSLESLPQSRPFVGIISTSNDGYALIKVQMEERTVHVSERLTAEAVACRLAAEPPSDPLIVVLSPTEHQQYRQWTTSPLSSMTPNPSSSSSTGLSMSQWSVLFPFLPASAQSARRSTVTPAAGTTRTMIESSLGGYRLRTSILPPFVIPDAGMGMSDTDRYSSAIINSLLQLGDSGITDFDTTLGEGTDAMGSDVDTMDTDSAYNAAGNDRSLADTKKSGSDRMSNDQSNRIGDGLRMHDFQIVAMSSFSPSISLSSSISTQSTAETETGIAPSSTQQSKTQTNPLYVETAIQLGLLQDKTIPALLLHVMDDSAPIAARQLIQRYLLVPPPPVVADALRTVVASLQSEDESIPLPPLHVPPLGKVLSLLRVGQASARVYGDLLQTMYSAKVAIGSPNDDSTSPFASSSLPQPVVDSMLLLMEYESGLASDQASFAERCGKAIEAIENVISPMYHVSPDSNINLDEDMDLDVDDLSASSCIPRSFLEKNEAPWRGRVRPSAATDAYGRVALAAKELSDAIECDFNGEPVGQNGSPTSSTSRPKNGLIVHDLFNNLVAVKQIPSWAKGAKEDFFCPRDRNGKIMKNRHTTERVQSALSEYVTACDLACQEVAAILTELADALHDDGHIPAIVQSAHFNLVLSAAFHHATKARMLGWSMAEVFEVEQGSEDLGSDVHEADTASSSSTISGFNSHPDVEFDHSSSSGSNDSPDSARFVDLWPYWMDKTQAVSNTFDLDSLFLLTAPNMSGKSTLMRSAAAAALLTACGLCAPVGPQSKIPRFDTIFCRGASADVPSENKSAFGAEMGDIAALLRSCGSKSLIFVDELGRGTSPKDGTRLAGAVLEAMAKQGMKGFFATHLHDLLDLPLFAKDRIRTKQMGVIRGAAADEDEVGDAGNPNIGAIGKHGDGYAWTYRLEDGVCTDSLALVTAARFGLPKEIIDRADYFAGFLPGLEASSPSETAAADGCTNSESDNDFQSSSGTAATTGSADSSSSTMKDLTLDDAVNVARELIGAQAQLIPPRWCAPASIAFGHSCVYIVEVSVNPSRLYVGETDNLQNRIDQHRRRWSSSGCPVAVIPVASKTESRAWESRIIQKLAKSGFGLVSINDGRTLRHFQ